MMASDAFDVDTGERLVTLTNVLMAVLGRYAVKGDAFDRGPLALHSQLRHLETLVHNYFEAVIAPAADPPAPEPH